MIPAAGYARRSTDMQEQSIIDQKASVERYAKENGFRILRWFVDDAISGTSVKGRDAFERMFKEAEAGSDFKALLCYDISRFSRGGTNETGYYLHRLTKVGIQTVFTAEGIPQGDEGELLQGVKSWQARQYSVKLSRDTIRGMVSMVTQRHSAPGGLPPFGYDKQQTTVSGQVLRTLRWLPDGRKQELGPDGKLIRVLEAGDGLKKAKGDLVKYVPSVPERVAIVKRVFKQYLDGYGCFAIASQLNLDGVPGAGKSMWSQLDIRRMISHPAYKGALIWNRTSKAKIYSVDGDGKIIQRKSDTRVRQSSDRWYVVEKVHEPLIDPDTFEKAQQKLAKRRTMGGLAKPTSLALLSGLIVCTHCKHNFRHRNIRKPYKMHRAYIDSGYHKSGRAKCVCTEIPADPLEQWVVDKVQRIILGDHKTLMLAISTFIERTMASQIQPPSKKDHRAELDSLNKRIKATVAMLADTDLGDMDELKTVLKGLKAKRDQLIQHLDVQVTEPKAQLKESDLRDWAQSKIKGLKKYTGGADCPKEVRDVVHSCVIKIEIDPHKKQGTLYLPKDIQGFFENDLSTRDTSGERAETKSGVRGALIGQSVRPSPSVSLRSLVPLPRTGGEGIQSLQRPLEMKRLVRFMIMQRLARGRGS